jgi:hypothetical protein
MSVELHTLAMFKTVARHVDDEVQKGRSLKSVLAELQQGPGGQFWGHREALTPFSTAIQQDDLFRQRRKLVTVARIARWKALWRCVWTLQKANATTAQPPRRM